MSYTPIPFLPYSSYPVYSELRCGCGDRGCAGRCSAPKYDTSRMIPGVAYKNGKPYNCNCDHISAPYSMPYEATGCKQCQPPYQAAQCADNCKCHQRASIFNNNAYEALGKWWQ